MNENPYEASRCPADIRAPQLIVHYPCALAGLGLGIVCGPPVLVLLAVLSHEYHDPPLAEQLADSWPGFLIFSGASGLFGLCFGGLLGALWIELRQIRGETGSGN